ncbi:MAG: MBL fold metallo-hydrolase, partial [Pseudomonadota bacterium]
QFARPEVTIPFDVDPGQAAETRKAIMERVAADRLEIAGAHVDYPGFGHVSAQGEGYRFTPSRWDHEL